MARKINRLNARAVATITKRGRQPTVVASISRFTERRSAVGVPIRWHGKPTEIGFGSARDVMLARARELGGQARTAGGDY